jgi:hypothetical protein
VVGWRPSRCVSIIAHPPSPRRHLQHPAEQPREGRCESSPAGDAVGAGDGSVGDRVVLPCLVRQKQQHHTHAFAAETPSHLPFSLSAAAGHL